MTRGRMADDKRIPPRLSAADQRLRRLHRKNGWQRREEGMVAEPKHQPLGGQSKPEEKRCEMAEDTEVVRVEEAVAPGEVENGASPIVWHLKQDVRRKCDRCRYVGTSREAEVRREEGVDEERGKK